MYASASGWPSRQSFYNNLGQLWKEVDPDGVVTLYQYNLAGELEYAAIDVNRNNTIDLGGMDRVTRTLRDVIANYGTNVRRTRTYVWRNDNNSTALLAGIFETSTDGLKTWNNVFNAGLGTLTRTETSFNAASGSRYVTSYRPNSSYTVSTFRYGRLISEVERDSIGAQVGSVTYGYDTHGRQQTITDARTGATTYGYNNADLVTTITTPIPGAGYSAQTTVREYNDMLQNWRTTEPDNTVVTREFFLTGLVKKESGTRTYPVEYTYDAQGRLKTMTTWQNFAAATGAAVTTWNYNPYRGWLDNKRYQNNTGPDYTYTPGGRLKTRTWARTGTAGRIVTTYTYGIDDAAAGNDHGDVVSVAYSNDPASTPGTTFAYDRRGQKRTVTRGGITTTLTWNDAGQLTGESYAGGTLGTLSVTSTPDTFLRKWQVTARRSGTALGSTITYGYDYASRLQSVTDGTYSATYRYLANSPLVDQITFKQSSSVRLTTTKDYDNLNRLRSISSFAAAGSGSFVVSSHAYRYNNANQRDQATLRDGSYWSYGYDALGQVTSAKKRWADGTYVPGEQFEYVFDDVGNRKTTKVGGDSAGGSLRSAGYTPNLLNQYSSRTVPNAIDILGIGKTDASITVNSQSTYRKGEFYHKALTVANGSSAVNQSVTVSATSGTTVNKSGTVFVPPATESYAHDLDGNVTSDGRWNYSWDAENRLIRLTAKVAGVQPSQVDYEYDWMGRRIKKVVTGTATTTTKFLYDGWNLVAEVDGANNLLRSYAWGLDLSGTLQGVGGVGGLLSIKPASSGVAHFCTYDGNGNLTALVDGSNGSVSAEYEYGPFGEVIRATGPMAKENPFWWSTKYQDDGTDLVMYPARPYNPSTGRFLCKDPIEERGGRNLYCFVENNPINRWDAFGKISEGGEWPVPPDAIDPPSGPFNKCRVALRCDNVYRYGVKLGEHCGLIIDTGDGVYAIDGSGGTSNRRDVTPATTGDATGPWTDLDPSACQCLFSNVKPWNDRKVPRNNTCENSNWNLKCSLKKCSISLNWGGQSKPIGYDCKECVEWRWGVPTRPPINLADCSPCVRWREKPCPDE